MFILLQRLDDIVAEEFEEGDYQEQEYQDQGQVADQGKPPNWSYPLSPNNFTKHVLPILSCIKMFSSGVCH